AGMSHSVIIIPCTAQVRVKYCQHPHHLLLTMDPGTPHESHIEAWLTEEGTGTRLVVEERGLPLDKLHFHGSGWQVHLEDLGRSLADDATADTRAWSEQTPEPCWLERWTELTPAYQEMAVA